MPFTQGMTSKHLKRLTAMAAEVAFAADEIIFREGDEGKAIYFIREGQVVVEGQVAGYGMLPMLTLGPGDLLGWSALFPPRLKTSTARAVKPTQAIAIDVGQLQAAFQTDQVLEMEIIRRVADIIADRLKATRVQLLSNVPIESRTT
jgi:CRP-like cAMP-binding protein